MTGLDPASLGAAERAAADLGISTREALLLQRVASDQLGFTASVSEPGALLPLGLVLALLAPALVKRRR